MSHPSHPLGATLERAVPRGLASVRDLGRRADHVRSQVAQQAATRISRLAEVGRRQVP